MRTLVKLTLFRQFYIMVRLQLAAEVVHGMRCGCRLCEWPWRSHQVMLADPARPGASPTACLPLLSWPVHLPATRYCPPAACLPLLSWLVHLPATLQLFLVSVHLAQVVVYIYFTRIIVYLLESTLPFQLIWLAAAASEAATLAFYIAAGVSFRCALWHRVSALAAAARACAAPNPALLQPPGSGVSDARRAASCWHPLPSSLQAPPRTTTLLQANAGGGQPLLPAD